MAISTDATASIPKDEQLAEMMLSVRDNPELLNILKQAIAQGASPKEIQMVMNDNAGDPNTLTDRRAANATERADNLNYTGRGNKTGVRRGVLVPGGERAND